MNFICQVRFQHTLPLTLTNRSNQRWILKPVIESQHWTGAPTCVIEPYHNKVYEVIYKPVVMTTDKKHLVGTDLLYTLFPAEHFKWQTSFVSSPSLSFVVNY